MKKKGNIFSEHRSLTQSNSKFFHLSGWYYEGAVEGDDRRARTEPLDGPGSSGDAFAEPRRPGREAAPSDLGREAAADTPLRRPAATRARFQGGTPRDDGDFGPDDDIEVGIHQIL